MGERARSPVSLRKALCAGRGDYEEAARFSRASGGRSRNGRCLLADAVGISRAKILVRQGDGERAEALAREAVQLGQGRRPPEHTRGHALRPRRRAPPRGPAGGGAARAHEAAAGSTSRGASPGPRISQSQAEPGVVIGLTAGRGPGIVGSSMAGRRGAQSECLITPPAEESRRPSLTFGEHLEKESIDPAQVPAALWKQLNKCSEDELAAMSRVGDSMEAANLDTRLRVPHGSLSSPRPARRHGERPPSPRKIAIWQLGRASNRVLPTRSSTTTGRLTCSAARDHPRNRAAAEAA